MDCIIYDEDLLCGFAEWPDDLALCGNRTMGAAICDVTQRELSLSVSESTVLYRTAYILARL